MKIFISMPMAGKTDEQIKERLEKIKRKIKDNYYMILGSNDLEFIDSYFGDTSKEDPVEMLGKSIQQMAEAYAVYFCDGWESARGCRIEHTVAEEYGKVCIYE